MEGLHQPCGWGALQKELNGAVLPRKASSGVLFPAQGPVRDPVRLPAHVGRTIDVIDQAVATAVASPKQYHVQAFPGGVQIGKAAVLRRLLHRKPVVRECDPDGDEDDGGADEDHVVLLRIRLEEDPESDTDCGGNADDNDLQCPSPIHCSLL